METVKITNAKYNQGIRDSSPSSVNADFNGITISVPLDTANSHYAEILRQVEAGTLTIAPADEANNGK